MNAGTRVKWQSQAAGSWAVKVGVIVEVVPPGAWPNQEHRSYGLVGTGLPRPHESYVVHVDGKTPKSKGKRYWPLASKLVEVKS